MSNQLQIKINSPFKDGSLALYENFIDIAECNSLYTDILSKNHWNNAKYTVAGRVFSMPRVQTWYADPGVVYNFKYHLHDRRNWTPALQGLKQKVEFFTGNRFNSVLINWYRDGRDWVDWHSDDEIELGDNPFIASFSLGATRKFCFRQKNTIKSEYRLLPEGSLLLMYPEFQHHWQHCIARDKAILAPRLNFTFRHVKMP